MKKRLFSLMLALCLCLGLAAPALAAGSDFVIENGVLVDYKGSDTVITIPEGVTEIGKEAFFRVSFTLERGRIMGLIGKNGAGKSTTIKMLSCLTSPTAGDGLLMGRSVTKDSRRAKEILAVSPQETAVAPSLTVAENLIANTVRFSRSKLELTLETDSGFLTLTAADDGPGFPQELIQNGPKPFGKQDGDAAHFGMGLYTCKLLCQKHGGDLRLQNGPGAVVLASFKFQGQT